MKFLKYNWSSTSTVIGLSSSRVAREESSEAVRGRMKPEIRDVEDAFGFLKKGACQYLKPPGSSLQNRLRQAQAP